LDTLLGGGLGEYSFNLIAGAPGSGKTTLAHQMMFALATTERRALFFTVLGEPPLKMLRYQQQFGFFELDKVGSAIRYVNLAEDLRGGDFSGVLDRIMREVEAFSPSLVFVDSFRSVAQTAKNGSEGTADLQQFIQELGTRMTSWQATTFLIGEYVHVEAEANPIMTVADGMVALSHTQENNSVVRKVRIVKMRGQAHLAGAHTLRITDDGIRVYPRLLTPIPEAYQTIADGVRRIPLGVPGLDDMLHGGLPQGHTMLVSGPTGIGKTILGTRFLQAGAAQGEKGVAVFFEKHTSRLHNGELVKLVRDGQVTVLESLSLSLTVEELLDQLTEAIERTGATRVVIDSLSEIGLYLAPEFRYDLRLSVFRTLSLLARRGVTALVTVGYDDNSPNWRFSIDNLCFLADAVLSMRFAEVEGHVCKFMTVIKVRGTSHSNELREYRITDAGIEVAPHAPKLDALMSGFPTRREPHK
jgi:circadian clock protein KaiC